jgi:phosphatidate phosphatase APP1
LGPNQVTLEGIILHNGVRARILDDLYTRKIHFVTGPTIVVSDIDDTLLHSNVSNKLLKFRTLMFTSVENRKAVVSMKNLIQELHRGGAETCYVSNSEQNLYPLIYRFLLHNGFPPGPLFLKQMRKVRDLFRSSSLEEREIHKTKILHEILQIFPEKRFFLLGDNTQSDLKIYLKIAGEYPKNISYIIIRKVLGKSHSEPYLKETAEKLKSSGIGFHYADSFPSASELL